MTAKKKTTTAKTAKNPKQNSVTIGKKDFLKKVSIEANKLSGTEVRQKDLYSIFDAMCAIIEDETRHGHTIRFIGFGSFHQAKTSARKGHNPQTGEEIQIPESRHLAFRSTIKF